MRKDEIKRREEIRGDEKNQDTRRKLKRQDQKRRDETSLDEKRSTIASAQIRG